MSEKKVLVVSSSPHFSSMDAKLLRRCYHVREFIWTGKKDLLCLAYAIIKCDIVICWFAADHAAVATVLARLLGKPSIVIAGGYDVADASSVPYGVRYTSKKMWLATRVALRSADMTLAVSKKNGADAKTVGPRDLRVIPLGVDLAAFTPSNASLPTRPIITTCGYLDPDVKGLRIFARLSQRLPGADFVIIGGLSDEERKELAGVGGANLSFTGRLDRNGMMWWLRKTHVYCQLSEYESFGFTALEAAACGAEVVVLDGKCGVQEHLPVSVADGVWDLESTVLSALRAGAQPGARGKRYEAAHGLSSEKRRRSLIQAVEEVVARHRVKSWPSILWRTRRWLMAKRGAHTPGMVKPAPFYALEYRHLHRIGAVEPYSQALVMGGGRRFIDIGACYGSYAVPAAKAYANVDAFEPHAANANVLSSNVMNTGSRNIKIHKVALSDIVDSYTIDDAAGPPGMASITRGTGDAKTKTLDDYGFTDIDGLKIDVEGHEIEVLRGARKTLAANPTAALIIEVRKDTIGDVAEELQTHGRDWKHVDDWNMRLTDEQPEKESWNIYSAPEALLAAYGVGVDRCDGQRVALDDLRAGRIARDAEVARRIRDGGGRWGRIRSR